MKKIEDGAAYVQLKDLAYINRLFMERSLGKLNIKSNDDYKKVKINTKKFQKGLDILLNKIINTDNEEEFYDYYDRYVQLKNILVIDNIFINIVSALDEVLTLDSELNEKYIEFNSLEHIKFFKNLDFIIDVDLSTYEIKRSYDDTFRKKREYKLLYMLNNENRFYEVAYCLQNYKLMALNELLEYKKKKNKTKKIGE